MARLVLYLVSIVGSLLFWVMELWFNYRDYAGQSPLGLDERYQRYFLLTRDYLVFAELAIPVMMVVGLAIVLVAKLTARPVRPFFGGILLLSAEFWFWRAYFFDERMSTIYLRNEMEDPSIVLPNDFKAYAWIFMAAFALVLFLREKPLGEDGEALDRRLRHRLRKWREKA